MELMTNKMTMSSKEISELLGSRHDNVKRTIETLASKGVIELPQTEEIKTATKPTVAFVFSGEQGKRDSIVVVAQLSPEFTAALVDRWQELERGTPRLPNFNSPAESARAWAEQFEANQIAQQKLEEAQPKIDFVDRYVDGTGLKKFRDVCRILNVKENTFRAFLINSKIMYRLDGRYAAYKIHIDVGRFQDKTGTAGHNNYAFTETLFTAKGVEWIAGEWAKYNLREQA